MPADAAPRPSPEPKARSRFRPAALIGLFALLGLVVVMVILVGIGMLTGGPQSGFPDSTRVTQPTGMDLAATLTAQAGLVITRHPIIPPQFEPYLLTTVGLLPNSSDCPGHSLSVSIQNPAPFAGLNLPPASVRITRAGSGDVAASGELSFSGRPLDLCLPPAKQELYLLSVDHPALIFESLVLRFGQGEEAGGRQVSYALEASNPDMLEDSLAKAATQPPGDLSLNWFLLTWGPEPFADRWVAELALQAGGGDGNYIFFTKDSRLEEPRLFLGEPACQRSQIEIGVTSGGRSFRRYFLLRPAGCYDELPAP